MCLFVVREAGSLESGDDLLVLSSERLYERLHQMQAATTITQIRELANDIACQCTLPDGLLLAHAEDEQIGRGASDLYPAHV